MKRPAFLTLRSRLILLICVAVVPVCAMMVYTGSEQRRQRVAEIQENALTLVEFSAREEEQLLQGSRQLLVAMADFLRASGGDAHRCGEFFTDILREFRRYANLGAVRPDGEVFCSATALDHPTKVADRTWFQRVVQSREFSVGNYQIGRISRKAVLVLAQPVLDPRGRVEAVVFAALDLEWLNRTRLGLEAYLPKGSAALQVDENGVILAHQPEEEGWVGRSVAGTPLFKAVLAQKKGVVEAAGPSGEQFTYAFAPLRSALRNREVYFILAIPQKVAFADVNRFLAHNLTLLGIVAALAIVAAWFGGDLFILRRVKAIASAAKRVAAGDLSTRTGVAEGKGELNQMARTFDEMAAALERREEERRRAEKEIRSSREQLRNLSTHLESVREEERTRMAREIHDELGQALTALKMDLSWLSSRLPEAEGPLREKTASMSELIDVTIQTVQRLSAELRPGVLDDLGLAAAIEWEAEEFQQRTGIPCVVSVFPEDMVLDKVQTTAIFRVFQETLTNVIRHARATTVEVDLEESGGRVVLEVRDNGRGITPEEIRNPKSIGIIGMRERVHLLGGQVDISGREGEGTRVTVTIPVDR